MRVLVLRPYPSAQRTATKLIEMGHEAILVPLTEAHHDMQAVRAALADPYRAIVITSAEAVRSLPPAGELGPHLQKKLFAVGPASAEAARSAGFQAVFASYGSGRELADLIADHYSDKEALREPILYLAGTPRASGFEERLREHQISFRTVEAYRMEPIVPPSVQLHILNTGEAPDAVLFYSREAVRLFFDLPAVRQDLHRWTDTRFLCISANVAAAVPERFSASAVVSCAANEESLLALL
ncbi:MAG: uroporphyrinogen-III synthase [Shinella sp.]|nr:uroporphyrinogen-III synthase [Shinella sp.]